MKRSAMIVTVIALAGTLAAGMLPAGAAQEAGVGTGGAVLSPNLTSNFPCGSAFLAFDAIIKYVGNDTTGYGCSGTIYADALTAPNRAVFSGHGKTSALAPFSVTGVGSIAAAYTYAEPCQDVDGAGPAPTEAVTGEAIGTLTLSLNPAVTSGGVGPTNVITNFWWSRVGLTAIVGLRGLTASGTLNATDANAAGLAAAIFIPTASPNCLSPSVPDAGDIIIASGTLSVGNPL